MMRIICFIAIAILIPTLILLTFREKTAYPGVPRNLNALITTATTTSTQVFSRANTSSKDGFAIGSLWVLYTLTHDERWLIKAKAAIESMHDTPDAAQILAIYGNGFDLTGNDAYTAVVLRRASELTRKTKNLAADEVALVAWAAKHDGKKEWNTIAAKTRQMAIHADPQTLSDRIAILRLSTLLYSETREKALLAKAEEEADAILVSLPNDYILGSPKSPLLTAKVAEAMLELSALETDQIRKTRYLTTAEDMLFTLSMPIYLNKNASHPFLLLRQRQNQSEADYYFIHAVARLKSML